MRQAWKKFADSIDAKTTRERVLIFAATIAVTFLLMNAMALAPVIAERKRILQETQNDQEETRKTAEQVRVLLNARGADTESTSKAKLTELKARLAELQRQIDSQSAELVPPEKMSPVLEKILAKYPQLELIEAKTLPRASLSLEIAGNKPAPAVESPRPGESPQAEREDNRNNDIYKHSVEIAMRGNYLGLVSYLKEIESLPVRMFWDKLKLSAADYPNVTMRLTVYTISLESVWLTI